MLSNVALSCCAWVNQCYASSQRFVVNLIVDNAELKGSQFDIIANNFAAHFNGLAKEDGPGKIGIAKVELNLLLNGGGASSLAVQFRFSVDQGLTIGGVVAVQDGQSSTKVA